MKKLAAALVVALAVSLTACGAPEEDDTPIQADQEETSC